MAAVEPRALKAEAKHGLMVTKIAIKALMAVALAPLSRLAVADSPTHCWLTVATGDLRL